LTRRKRDGSMILLPIAGEGLLAKPSGEIMTKIVDMQNQIEKKRQKELLEKFHGRVETIQKMIQCSACHFRCAMCGIQIESESVGKSPAGLSLCEGCRLEFEEYQDLSKGRKKPEVFWHNAEWLNVWASWLSYRRAISAFMNSREFKLLVEEMNSD
jgi:hypothetical protein